MLAHILTPTPTARLPLPCSEKVKPLRATKLAKNDAMGECPREHVVLALATQKALGGGPLPNCPHVKVPSVASWLMATSSAPRLLPVVLGLALGFA